MAQFKDPSPTFYNEYFAARVIVEATGGRAGKDQKVVSVPNANTPDSTTTLPKAA
jgi:hypothetical protein